MRRFTLLVAVVALVAVFGCTPTTTPQSTLTSTSTVPAQGLREVIVPAKVPIDSAFYPAGATVSAISFDRCTRLGYTTGRNAIFTLSDWACSDIGFPDGPSVESPPVPMRDGLTQYGAYYGTSPTECSGECLAPFDYYSTTMLRIRW